MKRLSGIGPKKLEGGIKKLGKSIGRTPLDWLEDAKDPTEDIDIEGLSAEAAIEKTVEAIGTQLGKTALSVRLKEEQERKKAAVAADDYFVLCFREGPQADAFLKAIGYPAAEINSSFIDGTIVADLLGIKLPEAVMKKRKLKTVHDKGLTSLAMEIRRSDKSKK